MEGPSALVECVDLSHLRGVRCRGQRQISIATSLGEDLHLGMLPWTGLKLTEYVFFGSLFGLLSLILALVTLRYDGAIVDGLACDWGRKRH